MYQVAHHELLASALAVRLGKEINPKFKIGTMISHVPIYPYSSSERYDGSTNCESLTFLFPDVQVRGYYPSYAKNVGTKRI